MDEKEGFLLIGTTTVILIVFLIAIFMVMLIYRRRGIEHQKEMELMNEKFARELLQTELEIQRQTMQEIGREIHDNVGQKLTLSALYANQLEHERGSDPTAQRIGVIAGIINESLVDLRSLSKSLTNDHIEQKDFIALIKQECEKANSTGICRINFVTNTEGINASYKVKNIVLRIIQEFVQNSLKHAGCSTIKIGINRTDVGLSVTAEDDGKGFETDLSVENGIGINNMKKRASVIGANFSLKSSLKQGTTVQLDIPSNKINA